MEPFINTGFDGPQHDEVRAGQRQYGDPNEPNDTAEDATTLVSPVLGVLRTHGAVPSPSVSDGSIYSIDGTNQEDWYRFTVSAQRRTTISVVPVGRSYDSSPQLNDGSCSSGNQIDSRQMANLDFELLDQDGATVLAAGLSQPAGSTETVTDVLLEAGDYFIRVFATGSVGETQLYVIQRVVDDPLPCQLAECADAPSVPEFPHNQRKNRYVSFTPENAGRTLAFQVEFVDGPGAPFALGWVGTPYDPSCQKDDGSPMNPPEPCAGEDALARLVDEPLFREWDEAVIHLGDCEIVPTATYDLRGSFDGVLFSDALTLQTIDAPSPRFWADVNGSKVGTTWTGPDGFVNVNDVQGALFKFARVEDAPHLTWIDLDGESPNGLVNVTDIQLILLAFQDSPYPFPTPADCP